MIKIIRTGVLLLVSIMVFALAAHYWIAERFEVLRFFYPVQATIAKFSIRCSPGSPDWMRDGVRVAIEDGFSLSNQLVFIEESGEAYHCESGWKGRMLGSPRISMDTRFRYASTTKLFTASAILEQVRLGHLSLQSRLIDILPEIVPVRDRRIENITIENLLMHTAGFDRMRSPDPMAMHGTKSWCPYKLSHLSTMNLDFNPGEKYAYSNLGYCLLGVVLERATETSYREWVDREYQLLQSGIRFVDGPYFDDEVSYDFRNSNFYDESYSGYFDFFALSSSAGLSGSAAALAKEVRKMLLSEQPNLMSAKLLPGCDRRTLSECYGFALYALRQDDSDFQIYVQPGFLYGITSLVILDGRGGVLTWLGNGMPPSSQMIGDKMTHFVFDALHKHYQQ